MAEWYEKLGQVVGIPTSDEYARRAGARADIKNAATTDYNTAMQGARPNQTNPFGSMNWTKNPDGSWVQNVTMNPADQARLDSQRGFQGDLLGAAGGALGRIQGQGGLSFDGLPELGTGDQARGQAVDSIFGQATSRLDPMWNRRESQLDSRLINQGLDPSSEAYKNSMGDFSRSRNDAYQGALNSAIQGGGQEAQRVFGMNLGARQQLGGERTSAHNSAYQDLGGLLGGYQPVGQPTFAGFNTPGGPNSQGAIQSAEQMRLNTSAQDDATQASRVGSIIDLIKSGVGAAAGGAGGAGAGGASQVPYYLQKPTGGQGGFNPYDPMGMYGPY